MTDDFRLSLDQLSTVQQALSAKIAAGLAADEQEIKCLPTYLQVPDGTQQGLSLVVDVGGTNMRVALVELQPSDGQVLAGPLSGRVPDGRSGVEVEAVDFFGAQASLAHQLKLPSSRLALGYCFSFPAKTQSDGDAVLLNWTKGIQVRDVVGHPVGRLLTQALEAQQIATDKCVVLNDTVASLMGGAHLNASDRFGQNFIGLILGTGTNMAGVFNPNQLTKVTTNHSMIVNLESGNFCPPYLTSFDEQVDHESTPNAAQRFEKAISGHYLPYLFNKAYPGLIDPEKGTEQLVHFRDQGEGAVQEIASSLLRRSAQLAAAGVAALANFYTNDQDIAVLGEGSLLWGDPQYATRMEETLKVLVPNRRIDLVRQRENVNLLGAACAALPSRV